MRRNRYHARILREVLLSWLVSSVWFILRTVSVLAVIATVCASLVAGAVLFGFSSSVSDPSDTESKF